MSDLLHHPMAWLYGAFWLWMVFDAVRREEWLWVVFMVVFAFPNALLYFFLVYRAQGSATSGFELPGAHSRKRIKQLEAQIHNLDKAHHHSQLGDIFFQQGKLAKAEACYRAALERDAEDIDTRVHLGQCLLRQGQPDQARALLEKVCAENPDHDYGHSMMALAETLGALGQNEAAVTIWCRVLELHSYARARVQLAELYARLQRNELARAELNEVIADDAHAPGFQRKRDRPWLRKARALLRRL